MFLEYILLGLIGFVCCVICRPKKIEKKIIKEEPISEFTQTLLKSLSDYCWILLDNKKEIYHAMSKIAIDPRNGLNITRNSLDGTIKVDVIINERETELIRNKALEVIEKLISKEDQNKKNQIIKDLKC
jgi:hypothetical protein